MARDLLLLELSCSHYPAREIEILSEVEEVVELVAALVPTTARQASRCNRRPHCSA